MLQEEQQIFATIKMYLNGNENSRFAVEDGKLAGYISYTYLKEKIICLTKYR